MTLLHSNYKLGAPIECDVWEPEQACATAAASTSYIQGFRRKSRSCGERAAKDGTARQIVCLLPEQLKSVWCLLIFRGIIVTLCFYCSLLLFALGLGIHLLSFSLTALDHLHFHTGIIVCNPNQSNQFKPCLRIAVITSDRPLLLQAFILTS
jgi:hypothetical protein